MTETKANLLRKALSDKQPYDFNEFFQNISDDVNPDTFKIKHTNYNQVLKILLRIKNGCSTGQGGNPI